LPVYLFHVGKSIWLLDVLASMVYIKGIYIIFNNTFLTKQHSTITVVPWCLVSIVCFHATMCWSMLGQQPLRHNFTWCVYFLIAFQETKVFKIHAIIFCNFCCIFAKQSHCLPRRFTNNIKPHTDGASLRWKDIQILILNESSESLICKYISHFIRNVIQALH
jgi:hypothetical protein